jgi:hypothetical protein
MSRYSRSRSYTCPFCNSEFNTADDPHTVKTIKQANLREMTKHRQLNRAKEKIANLQLALMQAASEVCELKKKYGTRSVFRKAKSKLSLEAIALKAAGK